MFRSQTIPRSLEWLTIFWNFLLPGTTGIAHHFVHKESKPRWLVVSPLVFQPIEGMLPIYFYIWKQPLKTAAVEKEWIKTLSTPHKK